jgi:hypothetical protein
MALASCVGETTAHQRIFVGAPRRLLDGTTPLVLSLSKDAKACPPWRDLGWGNSRNGLTAPAQ